jgi:ubiquinol-cytochrome c reductase cytochrome b subunit
MKEALLNWIDERTGLRGAMEHCSRENVLGGVSWGNAVRSAILFALIVQAVTGFCLWAYYSPSAQTAWESVYYIQYELPAGWLLRGIHHYTAQVLVALLACYFFGMVVLGEYRAPRELVYWTAMLMAMFALGLCLTGDLLPWDKNGYSATMVRVRFLTLIPWIGGSLFKLAAGGPGPGFGSHTLTRFFALHVGLLGTALFGLMILHLWLVRRAKIADRRPSLPAGAYWPDQAVRNAAACLAVMAVVAVLLGWHAVGGDRAGTLPGEHLGVGLGAPADQVELYAGARPEWSLRGVYGLSEMIPGGPIPGLGISWKIFPIFIIPGCLVLLFAVMPFVGRLTLGYAINLAVTVVILGSLGVLTAHSYLKDGWDEKHQAALADGRAEGHRAAELAQAEGIPATGARTLLKSDPKSEGPKLFAQHCASCHNHVGGPGAEIPGNDPSAPNLGGFATRASVAGFLDPQRIVGPDYFGKTKFKNGEMVGFLKGEFKGLDEDEKSERRSELATVAVALSAEARLKSQTELDAKDKDRVAQGVKLIDERCSGCHKFHGKGTASGPELTGYGSKQWLAEIVGNPAHPKFYGENNDRMPAYEKTLSPQQIELLVRFLRGEWYETEQQPAE